MRSKLEKIIKDNWLFFIIFTQPLLDIVAYFSFNEKITVLSFTIRSIYLLFILLYTFVNIKQKKSMIKWLLPIFAFSALHLLNSYRTSGFNLFSDLRYLVLVVQMPIVAICLMKYLKENPLQIKNINKGFLTALFIIFISVIISFITKTGINTYSNYGLNGWFTSPNTQSMILSIVCPYSLYLFYKKQNISYVFGILIIFILLFFNGTRACYYTLVSSLFVMFYILLISKKKFKNIFKTFITIFVFVCSILFYNFSTAAIRESDVKSNIKKTQEIVEELNEKTEKSNFITLLKSNYQYKKLIDDFGEKRVIDELSGKISSYNLTDNRMLKKIYSRFIFEDSDIITKFVGFNHSEIDKYGMDLENDLTAIFYYYGYLGFALYVIFLLYFIFLALKLFIKNPTIIFNGRFVILSYLIALSILGSELSGALLRKTNANIYFSIILALYYLFITSKLDNSDLKKNKLTFFVLHLGYGGIETSTINTANALSSKYDIEIISFYNLKKNQSSKLNKKIKIKYLCDLEPNKDKFLIALKKFNVLGVFIEGIKSALILLQKKIYVIESIFECDSKYIVSTRYDFSKLLSRYANTYSVKIAQEHHYHNNDIKYINIIKNKYKNIDYLFALTETLKRDYEYFLKDKNNHTKIVLVPNMIQEIPNANSQLDNKNLVTVSRLDEKKHVDEIITIFSLIEDKSYKLFIIGDGSEYTNLKKQIANLNLSDRIFLVGYKNKEEIEKYLFDSDLFLMASETEGLPMVLIEAMSCGVPCIAYETESGVNDIIESNENGYVISNRNQDDYINKVNKILKNKSLRKKMGKNAKETSKKFSKEAICEIWYDILK